MVKVGLQPLGVWVFPFYERATFRALAAYVGLVYPASILFSLRVLRAAIGASGFCVTPLLIFWLLSALILVGASYRSLRREATAVLVIGSALTLALVICAAFSF